MTCPYLEYRDQANDKKFDVARAYCTVTEEFVEPARADICNGLYNLDYDEHCEIFLGHEEE
jgi:hypothetical protein